MAVASKTRRRRCKTENLPDAMQRAVAEFGRRLQADFAPVFVNRRAKRQVARLLESALPPRPRRPGRPGLARVTEAISMLDKLRRAHPGKPIKWIWRQIYPRLISSYGALPLIKRRAEEEHLRLQVRWRLYARRRTLRESLHMNSYEGGKFPGRKLKT
jgi:hypothetical protein